MCCAALEIGRFLSMLVAHFADQPSVWRRAVVTAVVLNLLPLGEQR
jgi:hypothetical protein